MLPELYLDDDGLFALAEEYVLYLTSDDGKTRFIRIPKGYKTNFASIPGIMRAFISPIDKDIAKAALGHDFLTAEFGEVEGYPRAIMVIDQDGSVVYDPVDWKQAIATMRKIMTEDNAPKWKSRAVYIMVRLYGFIKHKK